MMVAASKSLGKTQLRYLEALQLFLGILIKTKEKEMEKKREFYPMITSTVKTLIQVSDEDDAVWILIALKNYPEDFPEDYKSPIIIALLEELDRQYARWNKGESNGTR